MFWSSEGVGAVRGRGAAAGGGAAHVQRDGEAAPRVKPTVLRDHLQGTRLLLAVVAHSAQQNKDLMNLKGTQA